MTTTHPGKLDTSIATAWAKIAGRYGTGHRHFFAYIHGEEVAIYPREEMRYFPSSFIGVYNHRIKRDEFKDDVLFVWNFIAGR